MIGARAGTKLGGYPGVPQQSAQQAQQQQGKQQDLARTLDANSAGAATNAEDFTKQFMSDMFGGGVGIGSFVFINLKVYCYSLSVTFIFYDLIMIHTLFPFVLTKL